MLYVPQIQSYTKRFSTFHKRTYFPWSKTLYISTGQVKVYLIDLCIFCSLLYFTTALDEHFVLPVWYLLYTFIGKSFKTLFYGRRGIYKERALSTGKRNIPEKFITSSTQQRQPYDVPNTPQKTPCACILQEMFRFVYVLKG